MGYKKEAVKGVGWVGAFRVTTRGVSFVRTIVLARVLAPAQFGVFGIATLVLSLLEILTETGVNVVLIQKRQSADEYINTAWIVSIVRGLFIAFLLVILAPFIAAFFNSSESETLVYLISLVAIIRGFINPSIVNMQKNLQFGREFWFRFVIFAFDSFVAVVVSLMTRSATGMVIGLIAGSLLELAMSFVLIKPRPKFIFEAKKLGEVVGAGKWVTTAGVFQFGFRQGDDAVVGKILGETQLGFYQVAYKISTLPISEVTDVFNRVVFPVYTKIAHEKQRLRRAFIKTTAVVFLLSSVMGIFLFLLSDYIVPFVLGDQWLPVVPLVKILSIFGIVQAVSNSANSLLLAAEGQKQLTNTTFVSVVAMLAAIIPLTRAYGLIGASLAPLVGAIAAMPLVFYYVYKILWQK
ncbi:lipopolysaccharide biosynthesis protein [Candidatus Microgenomates bacterium]|nr:MAG: lipopolysaccharide biosynthesis protein [Candidatus Microgenomates bacterium]